MSLAVPRETIDIEHMIWKGRIPCTPAGRTMRTGTPRWVILSTLHAAGQSGQSSGNLVPRKRFRQNQMNFAKCFVPRKRFIRDKAALTRRRSEICEAYTGDISQMNPENVRKIRPFHGQCQCQPVMNSYPSDKHAIRRHDFHMRTRKTHFFGIRKQSRTRQVDIVLG